MRRFVRGIRFTPALRFSGCVLLILLGLGIGRAQAPLTLFNGTSLLGWNTHGTWTATGGNLTTSGTGNRSAQTVVPFADLRLYFEYNVSAPAGTKLRLWTDHDGNGGLSIDLDPLGASAGVGGIEQLSHSSLTLVGPGWHHVQVEASHGVISTRIDGQPSGSASNLGMRAGFIGFEASGEATLQVRAVKLTPLNLNRAFNGTDLSGWKSIARNPDAKGGVGHDLTKTFTLGIGGGSTKPHEAKWSVVGGSIHGEDGPGGLEDSTPTEDGIVQIAAAAKGSVKKEDPLAISVRTSAGQLSGGYEVGIGPFAGEIANVVKRAPLATTAPVDETIVFAGRTIAIWVDGAMTTVHTDTRAENSSPLRGAKTGAGTTTLLLPGGEQMNVARIGMSALPKTYGVTAHAAPPPAPAPVPVAAPASPATATVAAAPPSDAEKVLLAQQQAAAKKDASDQSNKQRVALLMSQALSTSDPHAQMDAYAQVVQIDPSNTAAVQGYKEAQSRVQAQQDEQQRAASAEITQQQQAETQSTQAQASLTKAQAAFLAGRLTEASAALSVAEHLAPNNALTRDLRSRIGAAQAVRSRLYFLGGGVGLLGGLSLIALWLNRRRQQRYPVLEITRGLETGRTFPLERETVSIGAVAQNGPQKNDIVIQDVEHAISRFHCEVARKNGQMYVTDLKSSNGTLLNGQPLPPGEPHLLRRGNTITLANNVDLRFDYNRRPKSPA